MTNLKQLLEKILKQNESFLDSETKEINYNKVKDLSDKADEKLISLLLENDEVKSKFFTKIRDICIFKTNDFKFFLDENKINNSYTQYANQIGLYDGKEMVKDSSDVVLNFPFKDCVLEGGQSTEEGTDTYFEYSVKDKQYEKKESKRNEIFFNQVLAQDEIDRLFDKKALVNWKRYTKDSGNDGEEVKAIQRNDDGTIKENLIIKGNNLLALHSLKSQFTGKVKLIYIDPPYNTGSDGFQYNDNFNHSTWLTFMKNRLEIARELLTEDGVIFVQCDDNEQAYLKVLMDSLLKDLDFVACISVKSSTPSGRKTTHKDKTIIKQKDHILVYKKPNCIFIPQYIKKQEWDTHYSFYFDRNTKEVKNLKDILVQNKIINENQSLKDFDTTLHENIKFYLANKDSIFRGQPELPQDIKIKSKNSPEKLFEYKNKDGKVFYAKNGNRFHFLSENVKVLEDGSIDIGNLLTDIWTDIDFQNTQNEGGTSLPSGKKPESLIKRIISLVTDTNDIVLDYHLGSGTTCAVAHKMGRQYIGIEQLNYGENDSVVRLKNVINGDESGISKSVSWKGGGSFIYCELAKWNEKAVQEINEAKDLEALEKLFDDLCDEYFLNYNVKVKLFREKVIKEDNFRQLSLDEQKRMFLTMLDLNQMYVQESEMTDKRFGISKLDQELSKEFYK